MLDVSGLQVEDSALQEFLLTKGIGVATGRPFYHISGSSNWLRIALARDTNYFGAAVDRLCEVLTKVGVSAEMSRSPAR